jgi:hypothetical protein
MARRVCVALLPLLYFLSCAVVSSPAQEKTDKIKAEYEYVSSLLEPHIVEEAWIDDAPDAPALLERKWSLAGQWVAAWLNENPSEGAKGLHQAMAALAGGEQPDYVELDENAVMVVAPGMIGNVFIVARSGGRYRLAWSTAQQQDASGEQAGILAAWRAENARHGGRGPYASGSGSEGSVAVQQIATLPRDAKERTRFYINGMYAQSAGGTVGEQTSVWLWDGRTARPLIARDYPVMIDQAVGTRVEGDLLKVRQKKFFRTFFSCGMCEERQTDWIVRLKPDGVEDLGEHSAVPELDAVDELFFRIIHHEPASEIADRVVIEAAEEIVTSVREDETPKEWDEFPSLGMMGDWKVEDTADGRSLCLRLDDVDGTLLLTFRNTDAKLFITELKLTEQTCSK